MMRIRISFQVVLATQAVLCAHMNAHGGRLGSWNAMSNYLYLDGRVETHQFNVVFENAERNRFIPIAVPSK